MRLAFAGPERPSRRACVACTRRALRGCRIGSNWFAPAFALDLNQRRSEGKIQYEFAAPASVRQPRGLSSKLVRVFAACRSSTIQGISPASSHSTISWNTSHRCSAALHRSASCKEPKNNVFARSRYRLENIRPDATRRIVRPDCVRAAPHYKGCQCLAGLGSANDEAYRQWKIRRGG